MGRQLAVTEGLPALRVLEAKGKRNYSVGRLMIDVCVTSDGNITPQKPLRSLAVNLQMRQRAQATHGGLVILRTNHDDPCLLSHDVALQP